MKNIEAESMRRDLERHREDVAINKELEKEIMNDLRYIISHIDESLRIIERIEDDIAKLDDKK